MAENIDYNHEFMDFISANPCNFFVVAAQAERLRQAGYIELSESDAWHLSPGGKYFTTRNGSAIAAWRLPQSTHKAAGPLGFMIFASHSDSPTFRVKTNPEMHAGAGYTTLNVEMYGGALMHPWFDRPLSIAGRIVVRDGAHGVTTRLVNIDRDLLCIPSLAIHMDREANSGRALNVQKDLLPLYGGGDAKSLMELVAENAGVEPEDILSHELVCYVRQSPCVWGAADEFLSAPRLDDVQCAWSSLQGFLESDHLDSADVTDASLESIPLHIVFDNEEVGSGTKQGACSTFLKDTMRRIQDALGLDGELRRRSIARSFMISGDNGHALHPNYPEKCDPTNQVCLGEGLLIKHAANQKYTTDAVSEALVRLLADRAGVPLRDFANRSDIPGGSTLGNLSGQQVPVITADIGVAQLAMHSCYETCSSADTARLVALARELFSSTLQEHESGSYSI